MKAEDEKIIVGLDIGTTKICAIVGKRNEYGKVEVLGMGTAKSEGVKEGVVSNINKTVESIVEAIKEAEEISQININVVTVGIAGKHIKSSMHHGNITRDSKEGEITAGDVKRLTEDMHRIITEAGTEIIHVLPQSFTVDYEENITQPIGMSGVKLEADFNIITANTNSIRNIKKCIERAGLEMETLMLEPIASSLSVLSKEEKEAGVVLVDIGGGTTDIAIFHDNILRHTAVLPFGGNIITSDIKQGCSVLNTQAEQLKVKFGKSLADTASEQEVISIPGLRDRQPKEISMKSLAYIIEARMEEIIEFINLEIKASGLHGKLAGGIVLTGGGAMLKNLQQLFEYQTGMDTRIGYPVEHLGRSKHEEVKSPKFSTAIGLVLSGFPDEEQAPTAPEAAASRQTPEPEADTKPEKERGDLFSALFDKTKRLLMDDFDDKKDY